MDDSIVDIDEALSDSFSQPTDESFEDINAIVQQWKQSADGNSPQQGTADDKFLNTRTFTRPKRRVYPKCTPNMFATPSQPAAAHINLKIGGLVTGGGSSNAANMQRSFLGDISPPSSMCSTSFTSATSVLDQQMAGSLITSNDFTGINYFNMDAAAGGMTPTTAECFNEIFETSRPQVFDDISMLNAPYTADGEDDAEEPTLAIVDADIDGDTTLAGEMEDTFERLTARIGGSTADSFIVVEPTVSNRRPPACDADDTTNILLVHSSLRNGDQTFGDADDYAAVQLDATYDNDTLTNRTLVVMDAHQPLNVTVDAVPSVIAEAAATAATVLANAKCVLEKVEDSGGVQTAGGDNVWGRTLNDTFQLDEIQLEAENTFEMGGSMRQIMNDSMSAAAVSSTYPERDYGLQSTPIKAATASHMSHTLLNDLTSSTVNISPISNPTQQPAVELPTMHATQLTQVPSNKFHTYVRPKASRPPVPIVTTPSTDDELDDMPSPTSPTANTKTTHTQLQQHCTSAQRELDERQSLTNFEEFEKSLSLCQNDHDFDDMLNGLATRSQHHRSAADAQMRQSLDHIKKRHSLLNLEKQLEDQQRRHAAHASAAPAALVCSTTAAAASSDSNRQQLLSSTHTNRTASPSSMLLSTSGSGERLLRRSRVLDEYSSPVRNTTTTLMDKSSSPSSSCSTSTTMSDSKENVQNNFDSNRCATAEQSLHSAAPAAAPLTELKPRSIPNNRDRFKTIRISKRPPEHDAVPHIHDGGNSDASADDCNGGPPSLGSAQGEPQQNDNRATQQQQQQHHQQTSLAATASPTLPRRRLTRPSQLSGLAGRRDASLTIGRSNGVLPQQHQGGAHDHQSAVEGGVKKITSPMGTKAKSIQNLVERSSSTEKSADETNARSQKEQSEPVFKIPSGLPTTQRMRSIARPSGLIRPSSGFYSYGVRRNDSDTESGRMSPTNSLSSGSSKGSLYRAEADTASSSDDVLKIELDPIEPPVQEPVQIVAPSAPAPVSRLQQPKRSGIQPPSASGAFAAANRKRSGLPRPMSMANR